MNLQFNYQETQLRVILDNQDCYWFVANEVCQFLNYSNPSDIIKKVLDEDERKLDYLPDSSGQNRKTWTINEAGLYSLMLSSTKSEAKEFKRWITHVVLPEIRKAGKFTSEQEKEHNHNLDFKADEIKNLKAKKEEHQSVVNNLRKEIEEKTLELIDLIKRPRIQVSLLDEAEFTN